LQSASDDQVPYVWGEAAPGGRGGEQKYANREYQTAPI
jgi:hypothetical protein